MTKTFSDAVGDVLIGVEFEVNMGGNATANRLVAQYPDMFERVTLNLQEPNRWYDEEFLKNQKELGLADETSNPYGYYAYINDDKWGVKNESPMGTEWNFAKPLPFREYLPMMRALFDWFDLWKLNTGNSVRVNVGCGNHIHINVSAKKGKALKPGGLVNAYFADEKKHQKAWFECVDELERKQSGHCRPVQEARRVQFNQAKCFDLCGCSQLGTFEMRQWDSTLKWELIERRHDAMGQLIHDALEAGGDVVGVEIDEYLQEREGELIQVQREERALREAAQAKVMKTPGYREDACNCFECRVNRAPKTAVRIPYYDDDDF